MPKINNSCVSILPSLQNKPSYKWRKIHLLKSFAAKAPSPPGTEGCLQGNGTDQLVRGKHSHMHKVLVPQTDLLHSAHWPARGERCSAFWWVLPVWWLHTGWLWLLWFEGLRVRWGRECRWCTVALQETQSQEECETVLETEVPVAPGWWISLGIGVRLAHVLLIQLHRCLYSLSN